MDIALIMDKPKKPPRSLATRPAVAVRPPAAASLGAARKAEKQLVHIAGLAAVEALFARDPTRVERLYYEDRLKVKVGALCAQIAKSRKPYRLVTADEMERIAGTPLHGGVVAAARPKQTLIAEIDTIRQWSQDKKPLLILDGISNPHNLGAIIRTAAFFGIPRIGLSDHAAQAGLSDAAYRVAEGGFEYVDIVRIKDMPAMLPLISAYYHTVAAAPGDYAGVASLRTLKAPLALILGNEENGLPEATLKACKSIVAIAGSGHIQSLNVSASAAILLQAMQG